MYETQVEKKNEMSILRRFLQDPTRLGPATAVANKMSGGGRQPVQRIAVSGDKSRLVLAIGQHLKVINLDTKQVVSDTSSSSESDYHNHHHLHHGFIRLLLVHHHLDLLVTTGEDKLLNVWKLSPKLSLINSRELIKRATSLAISPDGKNIVVADKFGDVYDLPIEAPSQTIFQADPDEEMGQTRSEKGESKVVKLIKPIAGHVSLLTSLTCIPSPTSDPSLRRERGGFLVTTDRDEHVRISRYPKSWSIYTYLLGHKKFVSACLWVPLYNHSNSSSQSFPNGRLLTAGGDDQIFVWNLNSTNTNNNLLERKISLLEIGNGIKVNPEKQTWFSKNRSNKRRRKEVNNKTNMEPTEEKEKEKEEKEEQEEEEDPIEQVKEGQTDFKMCINKMIYVEASERNGAGYILVTSIGSSILAAIPLPIIFGDTPPHSHTPMKTPSSLESLDSIRYFDTGAPILDFTSLSDLHVLLSLDLFSSVDQSKKSSIESQNSFLILSILPDKIVKCQDSFSSNLDYLEDLTTMKELSIIPSQEILYPELILFSKLEENNHSNHHNQNGKKGEGVLIKEEVDAGGRSGKKVQGRSLSQKRCQILLAKSSAKAANVDSK